MFVKSNSLTVSEKVFDLVCEAFKDDPEEKGYFNTFNNCRETGLCLSLYSDYDNQIWAYECRNSDNIKVTIGKPEGLNDMFSEEAWLNSKSFHYDQEQEAAQYIVDYIKSI